MSDEKQHHNTQNGNLPEGQDALLEEADEAKDLKAELKKCREERDEYLAGWKRAKADLANYKREEQERRETILKYANEELIRSLLVVLDSFDLAIQAMERTPEEGSASAKASDVTKKGVSMIRNQLRDTLKTHGLERIEVFPGGAFDPNIHEAMATVPSSEYEEDCVVEEVEPGYRLHEKVLRASRVKVASSQSERNNE